jgi:hypothetical protein
VDVPREKCHRVRTNPRTVHKTVNLTDCQGNNIDVGNASNRLSDISSKT